MSANTEIIDTAYAAFARGDIPGVIDLVADDIAWVSPKTLPQGGRYRGKDGVMEFFQAVGGAWSDLALKVETVSDGGADLVLGLVRAEGTLRGGSAAGYGATHVFTIHAGQIVDFREYTDLDAPIG